MYCNRQCWLGRRWAQQGGAGRSSWRAGRRAVAGRAHGTDTGGRGTQALGPRGAHGRQKLGRRTKGARSRRARGRQAARGAQQADTRGIGARAWQASRRAEGERQQA